jgi:predicted 3-demethylubiquinone-9 3-methyltransferase (glyoxalase superfamily)
MSAEMELSSYHQGFMDGLKKHQDELAQVTKLKDKWEQAWDLAERRFELMTEDLAQSRASEAVMKTVTIV